MTVAELIDILSVEDPGAEVGIATYEGLQQQTYEPDFDFSNRPIVTLCTGERRIA